MDPAGFVYWSQSHTIETHFIHSNPVRSVQELKHIDPLGSIHWSLFIQMDSAGSIYSLQSSTY